MANTSFLEIDVINNTEKKYRVFIERHYDKIHHSGGISDEPYDEIVHYDTEITSGERVKEFKSDHSHYYNSFDEPANVMEASNEEFLERYYSGGHYEREFLSPIAFDKLIRNTKNGIALWRPFLCYDKTHYVDPKEISNYLEEIEKQEKKEEYINYVKSLVLSYQKEYIDILTPYYERLLQREKSDSLKREEEQKAISHILGFRKK